MKKSYTLLFALCFAAISAMLLTCNMPANTASAHPLNTSGVITGTVVNGTHNKAPVVHQKVTLQVNISHVQAKDVMTTTTDATGHFTFAKVDTSGSPFYAAYTQFQNGTFASGAITFDSGATQTTSLTVYDTTTSLSAISVTNTTLLFSQPHSDKGLIPVGEFVTFRNSGATAYVTSAGPANGLPMNLLRFALPAGAANLTLGAGFAGQQVAQVDTGFASTATLSPGTTQFAFAYDLPYTTTQVSVTYKAEYPTDVVNALVPTNMLTHARDFTAQPPVTALGQQYQSLTRSSMKTNDQVTLGLWDLPQPGEPTYLDFRNLALVGFGLAVLLALLLGLFLKRGDLIALSLPAGQRRSTSRRGSAKAALSNADYEAERRRLLNALLTLESERDAGSLSEKDYRRQRDDTRSSLRALLAAQQQSHQSDQGSAPTQATSIVAAKTPPISSASLPTSSDESQEVEALTGGPR